MLRRLLYCFVALAVEVLWVVTAFGDDPSPPRIQLVRRYREPREPYPRKVERCSRDRTAGSIP